MKSWGGSSRNVKHPMHELHLMTQIVKTIETKLGKAGGAKLSAVRLKVSALSHVYTHDESALQTAFMLAARGTRAEGAELEIIPVPQNAWCPQCHRDVSVTSLNDTCHSCGGSTMAGAAEPEIVLHELVVQE